MVGSVDGSTEPFTKSVGSTMKKVEESEPVVVEELQRIGWDRSVFPHCQTSLSQYAMYLTAMTGLNFWYL